MDITRMIEILPPSVKADVIDFTDVKMRTCGVYALRVLIDRLLTPEELKELKSNDRVVAGEDFVASYKYAPEIKKSFFYIKN